MKTVRKIFLVLITYIYLQTTNAIDNFTKEKVVQDLLILPPISFEAKSKCTSKQKGIRNYLICDHSSFEKSEWGDFLYKLSLESNQESRVLRSLTPEIYGALPLTQNQIVYYLSSLQNFCLCNKKNALTVTPFYYSSHYNKEKPFPTFEYNTSGFSINSSVYSPLFIPGIGLTYCYTDTNWHVRKNASTTHNIYLYPLLKYTNENLFFSVTVLGGYTFHKVKRSVQTKISPSVCSKPHSWELASTLVGGYIYSTNYLTFIPQLNFTQTNVFQSSIKESNYPNLKAASKNFRYLNMSFSLKIKPYIKQCNSYFAPSLELGWRSIRQLSDRSFISKLGENTNRFTSFTSETYSSNLNLFFIEGILSILQRANQRVELSYRTEFDKKVIASGLSAQITWEF